MSNRQCKKCGIVKSLDQFPKNKKCNEGHTHSCYECENTRGRKWRLGALKRPEFVAARRLSQEKARAKRYGLTLEQMQEMEIKSEGKCNICGSPPRLSCPADSRLHLDHDHATGRVRGLICCDCNRALGLFRDDPSLLTKAAEYLCTQT